MCRVDCVGMRRIRNLINNRPSDHVNVTIGVMVLVSSTARSLSRSAVPQSVCLIPVRDVCFTMRLVSAPQMECARSVFIHVLLLLLRLL